ncbi:MAG: S8 family serine peptidase [Chloroflexi bacterium]|nr:S8 family serine peptidase [Chloroflexota bacterium]
MRKLSPELRGPASARSSQPLQVIVLMRADTPWQPYLKNSVPRKPVGEIQWVTGEIPGASLLKLAALDGVLSVTSVQTYRPMPAPGLEELRQSPVTTPQSLRDTARSGGKEALRSLLLEQKPGRLPRDGTPTEASASHDVLPDTVKARDIHGSSSAWAKGFTGSGVIAAVIDTGVDFAHPDLRGTQARVPSGPYAGWPFAYNTLSGLFYAFDPRISIGPDTFWDYATFTWYAHTLPVTGASCNGSTCTASLKIDFGVDAGWPWPSVVLPFTWRDTSKSHNYYYTVQPDFFLVVAGYYLGLGYAATAIAPPAVLLSDEHTPGAYDTVYVDVNFNQDFRDDKPMAKGDETAGADLYDAAGSRGTDGVWDISAGMLTWIADGINTPPGTSALYTGASIPAAGRLLSFVGDEQSHGTNVAGDIAAQGVITDPRGLGPVNGNFAGAGAVGGVGGPVLAGMAPDAKIAAFQNGFVLPFDAWWLAALGFDGIPNSGDEAQIISNSWGVSDAVEDGWEVLSRFAQYLNRYYAPNASFLVATGNGGPGYGTVTAPDGGTIIDVGASTSYGSLESFEPVLPSQFTWGDVQPWSNRGPGALGDIAPDIVAVGAWGTGANPLNIYLGNGQAAYDSFGGTSMATPVAAGNLALVYQAFKTSNGRWPTWEEARAIFFNGGRDLGYDVLAQGSGNVDANRATDIAAGTGYGYWVAPAQWTAGSYRGTEYPAFPSTVVAGGSTSKTFTVRNTYTSTFAVNVSEKVLGKAGEFSFTQSFGSSTPPPFTRPTWISDITPLIAAYDPDLVRAQVVLPYSVLDSNGNYLFDKNDRWRVLFYDWTDINGDGKLWNDTNGNGLVDAGEIQTGEYNRFTYGYPSGTYLEASVGRDSLSRKHSGVFLALQRRGSVSSDEQTAGPDAVSLQVRITLYRKTDWSWLTTSPSSLSVPARGEATFNATVSVPPNTRPGVYEGAIEVTHGPHKQLVPVVVHVAANSPTFSLGATSLSEPTGNQPYDNGHLLGGFDWSWRYEAGDWKLFYFDVQSGTAGPGKAMVVDTQWGTAPTDVDTWILGTTPATAPYTDTSFFGPQSLELVGGSNDAYIDAGRFRFDTATGGPREVVGAPIRDGLGLLALHNVLNAGSELAEPIVGKAYEVRTTPGQVELNTTSNTGGRRITFVSSADIGEGIVVKAYGLSQPLLRNVLSISQDDPANYCTASFQTSINLVNAGTMVISTTSSVNGLDIDLYVLRDDGDGVLECTTADQLLGASTTASAAERVAMRLPADGRYWILVHGWGVPGGTGTFDLTMDVKQGTDLAVVGAPAGPVSANTPLSFDVNFSRAFTTGTWSGVVMVGPSTAPGVLEVPYVVQYTTGAVGTYRLNLPVVSKESQR